jgi:acetylcholinesterase
VEIEDGKIEGTTMTSRLGVSYDAFLRIPFAEPPINELRFQPPQPVKPWSGVHNGTDYGPFCMQKLMMQNSGYLTSEDCLQLNVFTKNLGQTDLKPTIVYIHGGAWEGGSGVDSNPILMMERDVVVVTINYRVGAFGFLATGTKDAYGNMALKDQVLALKWVKKNIEKFGGDSNKITIAGLSAGAHSVTAQVVSPMAKNLFHGAISQSGGITWQSKFQNDYLKTAKKLAGKLECDNDDVAAMVDCLKEVLF